MRIVIRPAFLALLVGCALLVPVAQAEAHHAQRLMVQKVNNVRASHGLPALRASKSLTGSSRRFARHILRTDRFAHASRIWASRRFRRLGETLAMHRGWKPRVRRTLRRWLRSGGHRALLLSRSFRYIGAGKMRGRFGRSRSTAWVVQLGR